VLAIWDRIFGTRLEKQPESFGLDLIGAENVVQLFSLAFLTERRFIRLLSWIPKGKK
jgi:sterol desaturase/sphingolipid hydroxylase (fatty acid hydroxylase superfamily)